MSSDSAENKGVQEDGSAPEPESQPSAPAEGQQAPEGQQPAEGQGVDPRQSSASDDAEAAAAAAEGDIEEGAEEDEGPTAPPPSSLSTNSTDKKNVSKLQYKKVRADGTEVCLRKRAKLHHGHTERHDNLPKYEEYCGEDGDEDVPCTTEDGTSEGDDEELVLSDDDYDYYYAPCTPGDADEDEDEEEEDEEEETELETEEEEEETDLGQLGMDREARRARSGELIEMDEEGEEEEEEEEEEEMMHPIEEDDEFKTLFMGKLDLEPEVETLANIEGVIGIALTPQTKQFFEINDEEMHASEHQVHKWLSWKKVKLHIFKNGEDSEFFPFYDTIKYYPDATMLLGSDPKKETGQDYFFCLTVEARNNVLNPPKRKKAAMDLKKQQEAIWNEMASRAPRKWRGFGSEVEVDQENVIDSRPLINLQVYRFRQHFGSECKFEEAPKTGTMIFSASFKSEPPEMYPCIQTVEVDRAIQVMPQKKDTYTQTGFSFKRNKMIQYSTQAIIEKNVTNMMGSRGMAKFFKKVTPRLEKVLQQNEMVDLLHDDYRNLKCKRGHEMEFSKDSLLLQEYQTYSDFKHSRGRTVTCMIFHPVLEDVVVMATAVDLTWERRIDAHSKSLMEPNYVLFWDLRDSAHPQIMLDAPADVFSFAVNPSDPHLVCGGCANGQIALWDLGRTYFELRAKIQDRSNMTAETKVKRPSFLDKLKDTAESLVCPLIPVSGLSNLDMSHKRAVTSVAWLPNHIEVGKNGMTYDNTVGRCVQFMSVAGDGTLRLWDTRPSKKVPGQADEDDEDAAKDMIKVNKWAHLENNQWKYHFRYSMDDGTGNPLFVTIISVCEKRAQQQVTKTLDAEGSGSGILGNLSGSANDIRQNQEKNQSQEKAQGEQANEAAPAAPPKKIKGVLTQNHTINSTILVGAETGQIGLIDWLRNKEGVISPDFGNKMLTNVYVQTFHHGAITCMKKSPFFPELFLIVGGGTISIWKETCPFPIFLSGGSDALPWCAIWSNARPTVFYVGNREGSVSIWDLMDRSNGPVMTQAVTNVNITGIGIPKIAASASKNQYLAVTDSEGVLLVLLLPRFYARPLPNEYHVMTELMNREDHRMTSWVEEMEKRADKIQSVNLEWQQSITAKTPEEANREEIEQEQRLNQEYEQFVEFEKSMIGELKDTEPPLPSMDTQISDEFDALIREAQKQEEEEEEEEMEEELLDDDDFDDFDDDDYDD